jgi:hypothetical protein
MTVNGIPSSTLSAGMLCTSSAVMASVDCGNDYATTCAHGEPYIDMRTDTNNVILRSDHCSGHCGARSSP